ncbi:MAG: hypothetical protein JWL59_4545 [Chthoniobacteraceae bacterium]|nr:hypothetical protein [Chthoniobacteraceae bacterium]
MSLLSLFKSKSPHGEEPGIFKGLWRRSDLVAFPMGDHSHVIHRRHGAPKVFPSFAVDFALGCVRFETLATHLDAHADHFSLNRSQVDTLQAALPALIEAGALVSEQNVRKQCAAGSPGDAARIGLIGFPTGGNRVAFVERALKSFSANAEAYGREVDFLVADSSGDPAQRDAFRASIAALRAGHKGAIFYAGDEEKRRFAKALIKESGCPPDAVEFALFDPLQTGFACGANRNALLLHEAGRAFCSVDDDVICRMAAPPKSLKAGLSLFSSCDPYSRWLFDSRESACQFADWMDADFLAAHEKLLGRGPGAFSLEALNLRQANDEILRRIEGGGSRVRATFTGHIGDPGIPTSVYYLFFDGENRRRLTETEAHYRSVFSSRSVLSVMPDHALGDASVSPGMAMGLDHRELLPPFFPVLHAEDFIYGATLWQGCRGALLGHLPLAILHEPAAGKSILLPSDLNGQRRAVVFEFAHILRRLILSFNPGAEEEAEVRLPALGRYLRDFSSLPVRDFEDALGRHVLEHESAKVFFLENELNADLDTPDFWRRDVEAYLAHVRDAVQHEDYDIPFDLKKAHPPAANRRLMRELIGRFGQLLEEWPAMVKAARSLQQRERYF